MSRLIPGRPPMSEDEFARKFRPGPSANPLADALDRATAGGAVEDQGYLPPALKASGGQYGRPLAPIQPAADAAVKAFGGSGGTFGPAYTPPGPEAAARTAMAAGPHAALAGGAMTGGRVVEGVRQRTAPAADPLPTPAALRSPVPVGGPDAAPPEPAFAPGPAAPAIFGQPAGFDPTQINPRSLWEIMNTKSEGGLSPAERVQQITGAAYGQTPLSFSPAVVAQAFAQQTQDENQALAKQRLANDARQAELQFSPDRVRQQQQDQFLGSLLASGKAPAEAAQIFQQYNALRKTLMPADPTAVPSRGPAPAPGQSPPTTAGGLPAAGGNPYAIPEGDLAAANQLLGETRTVLDPRLKDGAALGRTDAERVMDAIASRNLNPNAQAAFLESLFGDVVKNVPQFQDAVIKAAAKAGTNTFPGADYPGRLDVAGLPGLSLRQAESPITGAYRALLGGFDDAAAYRYADFGGRSVPLEDVGDVSTPVLGNSAADRQRYAGRLSAAKLLLEAMQKRGLAAQLPPQPPR